MRVPPIGGAVLIPTLDERYPFQATSHRFGIARTIARLFRDALEE